MRGTADRRGASRCSPRRSGSVGKVYLARTGIYQIFRYILVHVSAIRHNLIGLIEMRTC